MGLIFEQFQTPGLAQLSYLVGDDSAGVAAVIDPRRDVEVYLQRSRELGIRITHAIETHIHADFVSGAHELQSRLSIPILCGSSTDYQFQHHPLQEDDSVELGKVKLQVLHTPGHTPEHISLLITDAQQGDRPFGIFTGDFVFNLDVGRPDLIGAGTERQLARQLYDALFHKLIPLGDRMEIYPCHGAGSACGKSIGDRRQSTIGNEKVFNPAFQERRADEFVAWLLSDLPEPPRHYARLKEVNAQGATLRGCLQAPQSLSVEAFRSRTEQSNTVVIDTRSMLAFGGGHIPGAINIALDSSFPVWAGQMIAPEQAIVLVTEGPAALMEVTEHLFRIGLDNVVGYLYNGMTHWQTQGLPLERTPQITVSELNAQLDRDDLTILDVRSDQEFRRGKIPGAHHIFLPHLQENLNQLDRTQTIVTYCGSGYRASIAASLLQKNGFESVMNVPGSWSAWKAKDYPVERPEMSDVA